MLIPKRAFEVHRTASKDPTRPQLTGVHFSRSTDGKGRAESTDGHSLTRYEWPLVDAEEFPTVDGVNPSHVMPFTLRGDHDEPSGVTVPTSTCKAVYKAINGTVNHPILGNAALDEEFVDGTQHHYGSKDSVRLATTDLANVSKFDVEPCGMWPNTDYVFRGLTDEVSARLNPFLVRRAMDTLIKTLGLVEKDGVAAMHVTNSKVPIRFVAEKDGHKVQALVMPLVTG